MNMKLITNITLILLFFSTLTSGQYLKQKGKYIVDGNDNPFIIRSMGLGGWMVQEGYMMETAGFAGPQYKIRAKIEQAIGLDRTNEFYNDWLANHVRKADIDSMAKWGFNAIRPALHYNLFTLPIEKEPKPGQDTWLEIGFKMLDDLIEWSKANKMYVILDLHAAPGGQGKNADISDYDPTKPSLWESPENKRKTIALWKKLAERYANEKWVGGYDLINETNWGFDSDNSGCGGSNAPLLALMKDITTAIREVDKNHLIIIEGNCWANNMDGLFPAWDNNMAYSFHKYWSGTETSSIQGYLDLRHRYNVPMWMGESGENSNQWFAETIKMLEKNNVGWSWWPLKKIGSVVNPLTVVKTSDYQQLLNTWNKGWLPEADFCYNTLMKIADNLKIENCTFRPDVIDAMFRQINDSTTKAYKKHIIPGIINAVDFDMGLNNVAYSDKVVMNTKGNGGETWNNGWVYKNDGVDIETCSDISKLGNGFNVGWIDDNEWMKYTVNITEKGTYDITFRIASNAGAGKFRLEIDNKHVTGTVSSIATSGWQNWRDVTVKDVVLYNGIQQMKFYVEKSGFNLNYIQFVKTGEISSAQTKELNAFCSTSGNKVYLAINKIFDTSVGINKANFAIFNNGEKQTITSAEYDITTSGMLILTLDSPIKSHDIATISYTQNVLIATDGQKLRSFQNLSIDNRTPFRIAIPGRIESENFSTNNGMVIETCTDIGGGSNMGYADAGDYLDYKVLIKETGKYRIYYRIASNNSGGGKIDMQLIDMAGITQTIQSVNIPYTNGWQTWNTINADANITKGEYILRMLVKQKEFNINWLHFDLLSITSNRLIDINDRSLQIFPNPATDKVYVNFKFSENEAFNANIYSLQGSLIRKFNLSNGQTEIDIKNLSKGIYLLGVTGENYSTFKQFIITDY